MGIFLNAAIKVAKSVNFPLPVGETKEPNSDEMGHVSSGFGCANDAPLASWLTVRLNKAHKKFSEAWAIGPEALEEEIKKTLVHEKEHIKQYLELEKRLGDRSTVSGFVYGIYQKYPYEQNPLEISAFQAEVSTVDTAAVIADILKTNADCISVW